MFSVSLPPLEPEGAGRLSCAIVSQGWQCPRQETLMMSRRVAPAQPPGSHIRYRKYSICPWYCLTSVFPSRGHVRPQLISIHIATLELPCLYVTLSLWPKLGRMGEPIRNLGQSEISPELFQTENELATLSWLLSGDGNCTHNNRFRARHYTQEGIEHRYLQNQRRDEKAKPSWASGGSQNNLELTHQGSGHLRDWY